MRTNPVQIWMSPDEEEYIRRILADRRKKTYQAAHITFLAAKAALEANPDARNNLAAWKTWQ